MTSMVLKLTKFAEPSPLKVAILAIPGCLTSAVFGLEEMLLVANKLMLADENKSLSSSSFAVTRLSLEEMNLEECYQLVIIPPSIETELYFNAAPSLRLWLQQQHARGAILCSACAGAFVLAAAGLLNGRKATTHWGLVETFETQYPQVKLEIEKIMVNEGDIITAAGMMSWLDLGLELVAQFCHVKVMRQLGKYLVIDTGGREQRYYQQFLPKRDHGDAVILGLQNRLQTDYGEPMSVAVLAQQCCMGERTFLRRFVKATGHKPNEYLQKLRIQKACDLLENSSLSFETIAHQVGYEDVSACRKAFTRITGLTPSAFRQRFSALTPALTPVDDSSIN